MTDYNRIYRETNKERIALQRKTFYQKNKKRICERVKEYTKKNQYENKRYDSDIEYRLRINLRNRIYKVIHVGSAVREQFLQGGRKIT